MTTGNFSRASGIPAYNVVRWCQRGLIPGVTREETMRGPVWVIPASALETLDEWRPVVGRPRKAKESARAAGRRKG